MVGGCDATMAISLVYHWSYMAEFAAIQVEFEDIIDSVRINSENSATQEDYTILTVSDCKPI